MPNRKDYRLLMIFETLFRNQTVNKRQLADSFGVSMKSIQRDIADLNYYFKTFGVYRNSIVYNKKTRAYQLQEESQAALTKEQCLSLTKLILESRGFSKDDMSEIFTKLMFGLPEFEKKLLENFYAKEIDSYVPTRNSKTMFRIMWDMSVAAKEQHVVRIKYCRIMDGKDIEMEIEPLSIMFSEYYFYLLAYERDGGGTSNPITFRLDRFTEYRVTDEKFRRNSSIYEQFNEGEFRQRMQFMKFGEKITVTFEFWGRSIDAVLDRLPTARVIEYDGASGKYMLRAEIYGRGVKMWFLSQAENLRVISPPGFVDEMRETIRSMLDNYI